MNYDPDLLSIGEARELERLTGLTIDEVTEAVQAGTVSASVATAIWFVQQPLGVLFDELGNEDDAAVADLLEKAREAVS